MIPVYTADFEAQVEAWARAQINNKRGAHVEGVVEMVDALALRYAPDDVMRARLAGWIHDAAKHWTDADLLAYAETHGLLIREEERAVPMLLHGAVGYALAAAQFGIDDPALASACSKHTTGDPDMSTLDKIVFLGDMIELRTRDFPGIDSLREDALRDLDAALLRALDMTLLRLIERGKQIDPRPLLLRNRLLAAGVRYARL
jgi:predicted HD superfamily hydrolase involved in NAD metabolism